jgi:hypothetical protein
MEKHQVAGESLNSREAAFLGREIAMRNGLRHAPLRRLREERFFRDGKRTGQISAGLLLDFRSQMRRSGANESALMQTKQRNYRWAQTEPAF